MDARPAAPARPRPHRAWLGLAAGALALGCGAAGAVAAPEISGADTDVWTLASPVPTYEITTTALAGGVSWSVDGGSPSGNGATPLTVKLPGIADGLHTLVATDLQPGDTTPAQRAFRVNLTPPKITVTQPTSGAQFDLGALVAADYACEGAVTCAGTVAPGAAIDTSKAGTATFTVKAADDVGNEAVSLVDYSVRAPGIASGGATVMPSEPISLVPTPGTGTGTRRPPYRPRTLNAGALRPRAGLRIPTRTPLLRWGGRRGATLYNVQIYWLHGSSATKVVSLFPRAHHLRVPAGRVAFGHTYIWRVWPYLKGRYTDRPLGLSYFSVKRPRAR